MYNLEKMVSAYIECALWSSMDQKANGDEIQFEDYEPSEELLIQAEKDCKAFIDKCGDLVEVYLTSQTPSQAGHDFWLTREGHGTGFWDRGLEALGERLSDIAKSFGEGNLYIGDDDLVYSM